MPGQVIPLGRSLHSSEALETSTLGHSCAHGVPPWPRRLGVDLCPWTACGIYVVSFLTPSGKPLPLLSSLGQGFMFSYEFRFLNRGAILWSPPGGMSLSGHPVRSRVSWGGHDRTVKSLRLGTWPGGSLWVSARPPLQQKNWL